MKKFYQIESYPTGDCFRTCLASIMESDNLEDIPNFMKDGEQFFESNFNKWLIENGYLDITFEINNSKLLGKNFNGQLCILTGVDSITKIAHSVVGRVDYREKNNSLHYSEIHNPSLNGNTENIDFLFCTFVAKRLDI